MREWLVRFLSEQGYVVHGCTDVRVLTRVWEPLFPQCVLFSLDARGDGLRVLEWLRERSQDVPVLGLASGVGMRTIVDAMRLGADNVLEKPISESELLQALQEVLEGGREQRRSQAEELLARLSPREREVLDLVANGLTSKQIALRMGLSKKTVDVHRGKLRRKLEADSVVDLVKIHARRRGGTSFL
jgi:RNA polymerase sigma factor (sigma-70 family)